MNLDASAGSKKSLRRKPPPPLDPAPRPPVPHSAPHPAPALVSELPQLPHLTVNTGNVPQSDFDITEELFLSYDSPRPKGPKQLPFEEYNASTYSPYGLDPNTLQTLNFSQARVVSLASQSQPDLADQLTPNKSPPYSSPLTSQRRRSFPPRQFQNLLQRGTSPLDMSPQTPTRTLPYPISDELHWSDSEDERPQGTPYRIPTLVDSSFMQRAPQSASPSPPRPNPFSSLRVSVNLRISASPLSSPTRHYRRSYSSASTSRSPSPQKFVDYSQWNVLEPHNDSFLGESSFLDFAHEHLYDSEPYTRAPQFDYSILPELPPDLPPRPFGLSHRKNDSLPAIPLDLPSLPFSSSSLSANHFQQCSAVWSLRDIFAWSLQLSGWLHNCFILRVEFRKALSKLLVFHRRDIPLDCIARNVTHILKTFSVRGAMTLDESAEEVGVLFSQGVLVSGVLVELTECYCHDNEHALDHRETTLKCYSLLCYMNKVIEHEAIMKATNIDEIVLGLDWASHWKLTAEDMQIDAGVAKRQSFLFDLVKFEQTFVQRVDCFIEIAGPQFIDKARQLSQWPQVKNALLPAAREIRSVHKTALLDPLLKILVGEGKFMRDVVGMARLYYSWSKTAKALLLAYMSIVPALEEILSQDAMKDWDELLRLNPKVKELQVNGNMLLMSTFNSRYQQLPLQLSEILRFYNDLEQEHVELVRAIDSIRLLGSKVNETKAHADNVQLLQQIEGSLVWKLSMHKPNIRFGSSNRRLYIRGDLLRRSELKIGTNSVHVIVLDNYILITERAKQKGFKVVEVPIPMDYLLLENRDGPSKSLPKAPASPAITEEDNQYPFKIRFAGRGKHQAHTLIAKSDAEKRAFFKALTLARGALLGWLAGVEPFKLEVVDNHVFVYEQRIAKLPTCAPNDPLALMAQSTAAELRKAGITDVNSPAVPRHALITGKALCSERFSYGGVELHMVGLSLGVYCLDLRNRWKRILNVSSPSKICAVPALGVLLVLAGKVLRYHLVHHMMDVYYERQETMSTMQLADAVLFFEVGRHREVPTLFVAQKKSAGSTDFRVYAFETANGVFSCFASIKRFYIQAECHGVSVFNTTVAIHTLRGFEVLDLHKLDPRTVPELPEPTRKIDGYLRKSDKGDVIRRALTLGARAMGMFKLANNREFLLVYSECAVFVNKSGKLSRLLLIQFDLKPRAIAFDSDYLFMVCEEVVEVWHVGEAKIRQVIVGKDLSLLNAKTLTFAAANPLVPGMQLVFGAKRQAT